MDRREAVLRVTALLGGIAFVGGSSLIAACGDRAPVQNPRAPIGTFSVDDQAFLDEIADTILPTTAKSPGAKAADTGPFMALMVTDCYTAKDQELFRSGMRMVEERCRAMHQAGFMDASPEQRLALLELLDREQHAAMQTKTPDAPTPAFRMMKELALLGFFTSEIGCTKAQRYRETPGAYQACVPYVKGEPAWAGHA